jgi:hypothetical protein
MTETLVCSIDPDRDSKNRILTNDYLRPQTVTKYRDTFLS